MPRQGATFDELTPEERDSTGKRFGAWVSGSISRLKDGKYAKVYARCDCGTEREVDLVNLLNGRSTSCGCGRRNK